MPSPATESPPHDALARATGPRSPRGFWIGLSALLVLASLARAWRIDADAPRGVSRDFSLTVDGSWYTAAALDASIGRDCDVTPAYDRPIFTAWARFLYEILSPALATTHAISLLPGLLAVLFTALLARRLHGPAAGLLAGALLGFNHAFWVFNRSALIYTTVAAFAALSLWLVVEGSRRRRIALVIAGWSTTLLGVFFLKEILVLLLPGLLFSWPVPGLVRRLRRRGWLVIAALSATGALLALGAGWHEPFLQKAYDYFWRERETGLLGRVLSFEERSGLLRSAPWMVSLAVLGICLGPRPTREERVLALFATGGIVLFAAASYSPLRYLLLFFPALATLAAGGATRGLELTVSSEPGAGRPRPGAIGLLWRAVLLFYFGWLLAGSLLGPVGLGRLLLAAALALGALALARRGSEAPAVPLPRAWAAATLLALIFAPQLLRTSEALAHPEYTLREAAEEIACVLPAGAVVSGSFAHVLTADTHRERRFLRQVSFGNGRLRKAYREAGVTHITLERTETTRDLPRRFAADGAPLREVFTLRLRDLLVTVYRFAWAEEICGLSRFERGVEALGRGELERAGDDLRQCRDAWPGAEAPCLALAELASRQGRPEEAIEALREASRRNPSDARPLGLAARLLLDRGAPREALPWLEKLRKLEPENRTVAELVERLRREAPGR